MRVSGVACRVLLSKVSRMGASVDIDRCDLLGVSNPCLNSGCSYASLPHVYNSVHKGG